MKKNLQQLFDEYISEITYVSRLSSETIRGYKSVFGLFLKIMPEVSNVEDLTSEILKEFFKRIQTRPRIVGKNTQKVGVKESTIKTQYSKLNAFFAWLDKKYRIKNPLENIKSPSVNYDDFSRLEDSEVHKIYSAISMYSANPFILRRDTAMISILLYCGLRKNEFISLRVDDIDMEKKEITIRGETSKSKKTKILKMHPTLFLHLKEYLNERKKINLKTEYLIASSRGDKRLSYGGLKHWTESLEKKSGLDFHLHQFRHTLVCKLAEANVSEFKIQKIMGHTSILTTQKYTRSMKTQDMGDDIDKVSFMYLFLLNPSNKCSTVGYEFQLRY